MANKTDRPLGVKLIAALFFVKASALAIALIAVYVRPEFREGVQDFIGQLAPPLRLWHSRFTITGAPLFILFGVVIGLGVWFLRGWAWALLLVDCGMPLARLAQFILISLVADPKWLSILPSSPFFVIDVVTSIFIVAYLLNPEVKRAFGDDT